MKKNANLKISATVRSGQVYNFIDALLSKSKNFYKKKNHSCLLTDKWQERFVQRIAEYATPYIVSLVAHRDTLGIQPIPPDLLLKLRGISLSQNNGEVGIHLGLYLKSLLEFAAHWLQFSSALLCIGRHRGVGVKSKIIVGLGYESLFLDGTDSQFIRFCREGKLDILHKWETLLIQGDQNKKSTAPGVIYCKQPIHTLLASIRLGFWGRAYCFMLHIMAWPKFLLDICRFPPVAILARDYAQFNVMKFVGNANAIEALIYTNSNYTVQPLWVRVCKRSYRTHMVWYSQNCFPFIYKDDSTTSYLPGYKHMAIDQHWVWTEGFQRYLKIGANQQSDIKIIGPVTWYLPNQVEENMTNSIKLVIFDVTPFKEEVIKKVGLYDNYYSAETVKKFINDIIYVTDEISNKKDGLKIELFLKHKRGRMDGHDVEYLQLVDRLDLDKRIKILPSNSNIYSLLSACDLSIAIPYTSTAYVSSSINKPTIYFDSTGLLLPSYEKNELISFAGNTRELEARIMGVLGLDAF